MKYRADQQKGCFFDGWISASAISFNAEIAGKCSSKVSNWTIPVYFYITFVQLLDFLKILTL